MTNNASQIKDPDKPYIFKQICFITKTRLYNFYHLKSHFCIVKLGFTGLYVMGYILLYAEVVLTRTHNLCFEQMYEKCQNFYLKMFLFWL